MIKGLMSRLDENSKSEQLDLKKVKVSALTKNMLIYAYVGFHERYDIVAQRTCDWLKHNFKGTKVVISRSARRLEIKIEDLEVGDSVLRLHKFPNYLKKLVQVNDRLASELKRRGFLSFEVSQIVRPTSDKKIKRQQAVQRTGELLEKTRQSIVLRDQLIQESEEFVESVRKGKPKISGLAKYARDISDESLGTAMSAIVGLKESDQTYSHSSDVAVLFQMVITRINQRRNRSSLFVNDEEILIAGLIHDIGKSRIPKDILESKERFDPEGEEMQVIRQHPEHGAKILTKMQMPEPIINIALCHHLKLESSLLSSYPNNKTYEHASEETRLLSIVDVYQALVGHRSYKKPWAPASAIRYIFNLVGTEHGADTYSDFHQAMGIYPVGSLVELSDGSLAFVTGVPLMDLKRPQVVLVKNSGGEDLTNNTLIDLAETADLSIVKDISTYEVYGKDSLQKFANLNIK